jgi:hypothetical protein
VIQYLKNIFWALCVCTSSVCSLAQRSHFGPPERTIVFPVSPAIDSVFVLPDQFIIAGSERVWLDSIQLQQQRDYDVVIRSGIVTIRGSILSTISSDTSRHSVKIQYQSLPFHFKDQYQHRIPVEKIDTTGGGKTRLLIPSTPFTVDDMFGKNLQKSGSIVRGFSLGTNRDVSLTSGFRMQMSGELTDDVDVIAALTDENTPIQPEGTTQTLQEIDKVFVELRSTDMSATLGDFNLEMSGNEFGRISRKLQGAKGSANYRTGGLEGNVLVSGAITRGKFATNQFPGNDGMQGPYRLTGEGNNRSIIVIAGSERVYINGERVTRGENADYTIDYTTAEITFMTRRLINRSSRIVVDFEYSDRQYSRSLIAVKEGMQFFNRHLEVNTTFLREGDNEQSPIDLSLDDTDKQILRDAGGNQDRAVRSGVTNVGAGNGQYIGIDSLVAVSSGVDSVIRIYRFAPTDTLHAVYSISFGNVGSGKGSYQKISNSQYQFVGIKSGNYEPIKYLPMPQSHIFGDIDFKGTIGEQVQVSGEIAVTEINPNRFSTQKGTTYNDRAVGVMLRYSPRDVRIGGMHIGSFDLSARERFIGKKFSALDRINDVEFNRRWVVDDSATGDEEIREGTITYTPMQAIRIASGIGRLTRGDHLYSDRFTLSSDVHPAELPEVHYEIENNTSENSSTQTGNEWIKQHATIQRSFGIVLPQIQYASEYLASRQFSPDTLKRGSYRFNEVTPGISIGQGNYLSFAATIKWHQEDSVADREFRYASTTITQTYESQVRPWEPFSTRLDVVHERRTFSEQFHARKNEDNETILLRWLSDYTPFDRGIESNLYYEAGTERSAKMERMFQHVSKGTGNYVYLGDANGNHIVDDQDFQLSRFDGDYISFTVPGEQLIPVVNVKASTRLRINPAKIIPPGRWYADVLSALSSETYIRVEERSTETDKRKVYMLNFDHFLSDRTTLEGNNIITQDFNLFENNAGISLRFRFSQRRALSSYTTVRERTYARDRSIRLRLRPFADVTTQIDYSNRIDRLSVEMSDNRARNISGQSISMDWSYRPWQFLEIGFIFGVGRMLNYDSTAADLNNISMRSVYSLEDRGQVRVEFSREEVLISRPPSYIPYELTEGRVKGTTWLWHFNFEYNVTTFIQASVNYEGRIEGKINPVHIGKAEVRAFF